ncbi:hypothetical protein D9619_011170 [Psilocybe cf. subviscida]|uniref:Uncharacterized protein n=1 Tax=Psilocybe cf. subviscida TaxID=2480587 RepID=A0A8H5BJ03_9AGAR|nr:hypothetical protein D9619_011170 [Psilocybe cf. subviscida]
MSPSVTSQNGATTTNGVHPDPSTRKKHIDGFATRDLRRERAQRRDGRRDPAHLAHHHIQVGGDWCTQGVFLLSLFLFSSYFLSFHLGFSCLFFEMSSLSLSLSDTAFLSYLVLFMFTVILAVVPPRCLRTRRPAQRPGDVLLRRAVFHTFPRARIKVAQDIETGVPDDL